MLGWLPDGYGGAASYARRYRCGIPLYLLAHFCHFLAGDHLDGDSFSIDTATGKGRHAEPPTRMATRRWS